MNARKRTLLHRARRNVHARGAGYVAEWLVVVAFFTIAASAGLMYIAGPELMVRFRADQRALAAPVP